jgi:hypothetical protein
VLFLLLIKVRFQASGIFQGTFYADFDATVQPGFETDKNHSFLTR